MDLNDFLKGKLMFTIKTDSDPSTIMNLWGIPLSAERRSAAFAPLAAIMRANIALPGTDR